MTYQIVEDTGADSTISKSKSISYYSCATKPEKLFPSDPENVQIKFQCRNKHSDVYPEPNPETFIKMLMSMHYKTYLQGI